MGIAANDVKKLVEAGFQTVNSLQLTSMKHMKDLKGLTEPKMLKIMEAVRKLLPIKFELASDVYQKRKHMTKITSGSKLLDDILGGGFEQCSITELYGEYRSGKSQLCHTLCVTCQLPKSKGGAEGKAMYIDTEGTFRPERIISIAERFGLDGQAVLDNIIFARAHNVDHQNQLLLQAAAYLCQEKVSLLSNYFHY